MQRRTLKLVKWTYRYTLDALDDMKKLDKSQRVQVQKAILKVAQNPLPITEGGYGKPLGNHNDSKLAGYLKIKLLKLGIRVVYRLERIGNEMVIVVVGLRSDEEVYKEAEKRAK